MGLGLWASLPLHAEQLDVLHWWTSASERRAADFLASQLAAEDITWRDAAIPGGGGVAAVKVLKSRVLSGTPPAVAQLIGKTLTDWADLGLVLELDDVAQREGWRTHFFPTVLQVISYQNHIIAAPLGIHRINTLLYNRHLFARLKLGPPRTWADVEHAAKLLRAAGVSPFAWSDEPWQIATVFEDVLLSEAGPDLYRDLIVARKPNAWLDPKVGKALARLRWLRALNGGGTIEQPWTDAARQLNQDRAGMFIMGDWAKGELIAWGASPLNDFGCTTVPGTDGMHLYSIDTLAMLRGDPNREPAQERTARIVTNVPTQLGYNRNKGAVPVRRDIDPSSFDPCAKDSWQTFGRPDAPKLPSLTHRMAADEATKDAIASTVYRFVLDERQTPQDTQRRLATVIKALAP